MASFANYAVVLNQTVMGTSTVPLILPVNYSVAPESFPQGFLDFQALGGWTTDPNLDPDYMTLRFFLGGQNLGIYAFHRWHGHDYIVLDRTMIMVPRVPPQQTFLIVEYVSPPSAPPGTFDYFFFGPAIVVGDKDIE